MPVVRLQVLQMPTRALSSPTGSLLLLVLCYLLVHVCHPTRRDHSQVPKHFISELRTYQSFRRVVAFVFRSSAAPYHSADSQIPCSRNSRLCHFDVLQAVRYRSPTQRYWRYRAMCDTRLVGSASIISVIFD